MNKYFLQNPEKNFGADPSCRFENNAKNVHFNSEMTSPRPSRRLGYSNSQLNC